MNPRNELSERRLLRGRRRLPRIWIAELGRHLYALHFFSPELSGFRMNRAHRRKVEAMLRGMRCAGCGGGLDETSHHGEWIDRTGRMVADLAEEPVLDGISL